MRSTAYSAIEASGKGDLTGFQGKLGYILGRQNLSGLAVG
jgi:hypothetical protein